MPHACRSCDDTTGVTSGFRYINKKHRHMGPMRTEERTETKMTVGTPSQTLSTIGQKY